MTELLLQDMRAIKGKYRMIELNMHKLEINKVLYCKTTRTLYPVA